LHIRIGLKHSFIALIVAAIVISSLVGPLTRTGETLIQGGKRPRRIVPDPVRNHIERVAFKPLDRPDVDLRPVIASMGIASLLILSPSPTQAQGSSPDMPQSAPPTKLPAPAGRDR
jgi:hypothetical protein